MEFKTADKNGFLEPMLCKAGDERVLAGVFKEPLPVDFRIISEVNYQILKKAYDEYNETQKKK